MLVQTAKNAITAEILSITAIKLNKNQSMYAFSEEKTLSSFSILGLGTHSGGDEEDVACHKTDLHSCVATHCANAGSYARGFKAEDHGNRDRC